MILGSKKVRSHWLTVRLFVLKTQGWGEGAATQGFGDGHWDLGGLFGSTILGTF